MRTSRSSRRALTAEMEFFAMPTPPSLQRSLSALLCLIPLVCVTAHAQPALDRSPLMTQVQRCQALLNSAPRTSLQLAQSLLATPTLPSSVEIGALSCLALSMRATGQTRSTSDLPARLIAAAERPDTHAEDRQQARSMVANLMLWHGDHAQALVLTTKFLEEGIQQLDVQAQIGALVQIAIIRSDLLGDAQGALIYLERATGLSTHLQRPPNPGDLTLYYNYGVALLSLQRYEEAVIAFDRADAIGARIGGQELVLRRIASHRAEIDRALGRIDSAEQALAKTLSWQELNDPQGRVVTLQRQARVAIDRDQAAAALALAEQAQDLAEHGYFIEERRAGLDLLADAHSLLDHRSETLRYVREARELDQARTKGDALNQLAKLQAIAERDIDPTKVHVKQELEQLLVIRNSAVAALLAVLLIGGGLLLRLRARNRRLTALSRADAVINLPNRREAERQLGKLHETKTGQQRSALILLELDAFKVLNDRHGQIIGDAVLRTVAQHLQQSCDRDDLVSRWNGASFLIARHDTRLNASQALANHLRVAIERLVIDVIPGQALTFTASVGVAPLPLFDNQPARLVDSLRAAERGLQSARLNGGNACACLWGQSIAPDIALDTILQDPARAMQHGQLLLTGSRPLNWSTSTSTSTDAGYALASP